jgi:hypothetical protein
MGTGLNRASWALALLAACACLCPALGKIHHSVVDADDRQVIQLTEGFGFAGGDRGHIRMSLRDITIYVSHKEDAVKLDYDQFGFFLWPVEDDGVLAAELATGKDCILSKIKPSHMPTFKDSQVQAVLNQEATVAEFKRTLDNAGLFYLYFANCDTSHPVSFDARIELYNMDSNGRKDYLSVGETQLEELYWASVVCVL